MKVAIYTWHGCVIDVTQVKKLDIVYVSDETNANVAYVNTHAQLEAMRDEAYTATTAATAATAAMDSNGQQHQRSSGDSATTGGTGPRVLLVGPADSGKTSLARTLLAYAIKLGRSPLLVDIDVSQNMLSVPGTLAALAPTPELISAEGYASPMIMTGPSSSSASSAGGSSGGGSGGTPQPIVLWYGTQDITSHPDLYKSQITKLGSLINTRLSYDIDMNASGIIVNTSGTIEDVGYQYLLHAIDEFHINVVLVLGHDRLYSMLGTHFKNKLATNNNDDMDIMATAPVVSAAAPPPKLIKLPRSGGVSERDSTFRRVSRSSCIKRYFYGGDTIPNSRLLYSPCLLEIKLSDINIHQITNISLSSALLAIGAKQSTDPIQLITLSSSDITTRHQHALLGVCHPGAVDKYESGVGGGCGGGGLARDLWLSGVAGFVVVEKVNVDAGTISLLCPCAGSLPSCHLLIGDVYWME
jgi:polyribonucleotide 5'-hydroxyl-kinase